MADDQLDMHDGRDRKTLKRGIAAGWNINAEQLHGYTKALDAALDIARNAGDQRAIVSCVKTMATIVGQVQADEHLDARLAAGKLTDTEVTIRIVRE